MFALMMQMVGSWVLTVLLTRTFYEIRDDWRA